MPETKLTGSTALVTFILLCIFAFLLALPATYLSMLALGNFGFNIGFLGVLPAVLAVKALFAKSSLGSAVRD